MKALWCATVAASAWLGVVSPAYSESGFVYSGGSYTTIAPPDSLNARASGINDSGQIVGSYSNNGSIFGGNSSGYLYSGGIYTTIAPPGSTNTFAYSINNSGQIVGTNGPVTPATPPQLRLSVQRRQLHDHFGGIRPHHNRQHS
jgi:uncharacterized membrane protein